MSRRVGVATQILWVKIGSNIGKKAWTKRHGRETATAVDTCAKMLTNCEATCQPCFTPLMVVSSSSDLAFTGQVKKWYAWLGESV